MRASVLALSLLVTPALAEPPRWFGYVGVACGLDDPHDDVALDDYTAEVAGFTNLNQVCLSPDPAVTAARLQRVTQDGGTALFAVEPALFLQTEAGLQTNPDRQALWPLVQQGIDQSGVSLDQILFYVVDEPRLRHLPPQALSETVAFLKQSYPTARTLVIDAYDPSGPAPIPPDVDFWGFDAYGVRDPGAEPLFTSYLDRAKALLGKGQGLVLVVDAMHTPVHAEQGIAEDDMAGIATAYLALAQSRGDIAALIAYAWAGGIDGTHEKGVRDLPQGVQDAHRAMGAAIVGR